MKYVLAPYKQVGSIEFSMKREDLRALLKIKPKEFKKTKFSKNTTDDFGSFHVYYDKNNTVEAVEFFDQDCEISLDDIKVLPQTFTKLKNNLLSADNLLQVKGDGLTSLKYGLAVYSPEAAEKDDARIESVIVFRKGYYD